MSGPDIDRAELIAMACKAGASVVRWGDAVFARAELEAFYRLAYAAGQAAERAKVPPAPLIVDASHIDSEALAEAIKSLKRARPVLVAGTPRPDEIAAAVAAEREACALACENVAEHNSDLGGKTELVYQSAAAIRARSQQ